MVFFLSCKYYAFKTYKIDRKCPFKNKKDYVFFIQKDPVLHDCNMLVLNDSSFSSFFLDFLQNKSSIVFIGAYINDSIKIKKSYYLNQQPNCSERIIDDIKKMSVNMSIPDSLLIKTEKINSYIYSQIHKSDAPYSNLQEPKIKIYLSYSYAYGNYYYALYKKINEICRQSHYSISLYLISLDPFYQWN